MQETPTNWFFDYVAPDLIQAFGIKDILYSGRSKFQSIEVLETTSFGRCLVLDGKIQCSERDEFIYHEALVHPPLTLHPHPETVFIAGGGEGATLREVLIHSTVKKAVMVDIDEEVIAICKKFLPSLHQGSFEDERASLHLGDAREYLTKAEERFDVIIIDLPEPIEEGPAYLLYTTEFYEIVKGKLREEGIISLQAGSADLGNLLNFIAVNNTLRTAFATVSPYLTNVPSFGGSWGFSLASQSLDPLSLPPEEVDRRLSRRVTRGLRFYDGPAHRGIFSLPKYLRQEMEKEKRIITDKKPLFTY